MCRTIYRQFIADLRSDTFPDGSQPSSSTLSQHGVEVVPIDELLSEPGRKTRPAHIVVVLRGLPGAGKTFLGKLIKV